MFLFLLHFVVWVSDPSKGIEQWTFFTVCVSSLQVQWNQTMPTATHSLAMTWECWWEAFDYVRVPGHPTGWTWDWYYKTFHIQFMTNWYLEYKILQIIFKVQRYNFWPLLVDSISWVFILIVRSTLQAASKMLTLFTFWINISQGYHENLIYYAFQAEFNTECQKML